MTGPFTPGGTVSPNAFPCGGCGARVEFAPGTTAMRCPYCGYEQQISHGDRQIREHGLAELGTLPRKPVAQLAAYVYVCQRCAAQTQSNETATLCQFCGSPLVLDPDASGQIVPEAVLPFALDRNGVRESLRKWINSRWFAPNALKKVTEAESTRGTYVPHWTYDSQTYSSYSGARGEHYYVTETYTDSDGRTQTRRVQKTRWYPVSGQVSRFFDDVLVPASMTVPPAKVDALAPWPLPEAAPYQPQYLAGLHALRYDIEPETGLDEAKRRMDSVIHDDCRRDIGGDEQRVDGVNTNYTAITFKLMLLPIWIACYLYGGKTWQILVNGRTGEVHGERPYSKLKIFLAVLLAIVVVVVILYFWLNGHHTTTTSHTTTTRHH
ncbi:NADH pyrophosphatase zinc ribbon domain-containing protein [Kutzneria kofuensis]|uniref:DNA-directed RNA polymerase subunit RPC12/RpoP n=1 Tax=Kutzneria kofuensis TaxID=103725 RepID=A0A7W9NJQ9_9PSEU|nr:NADH pyrophosphatase zinc ribbon domain-containing protein [Kutzneria kofuensis]MBB5894413.1 DNA-directed RNA polymerase subunit RPC12/RpoP [Kutzneria kofuensis]